MKSKLYISRWPDKTVTISYCPEDYLDVLLDRLADPKGVESVEIPSGISLDELEPKVSDMGWEMFKLDIDRFKGDEDGIISFCTDEQVKQYYKDTSEWAAEHNDKEAQEEALILKPFIDVN